MAAISALLQVSYSARRTNWGFALEFHPIKHLVEQVPATVWERLAEIQVPILVNGALSLHHIALACDHDLRLKALMQVRRCRPAVIVLTEPNVDHMTEDRPRRLRTWPPASASRRTFFTEVLASKPLAAGRLGHARARDSRHEVSDGPAWPRGSRW